VKVQPKEILSNLSSRIVDIPIIPALLYALIFHFPIIMIAETIGINAINHVFKILLSLFVIFCVIIYYSREYFGFPI
jgi:hypothetical protein